MKKGETGFLEIDGQQIYYQVKGEGPPMVFVHGWTLNLSYWDAQVAHFSEHYRTYCYDWRGMGKSSGATPPFTMEQLGMELGGFIAALGIENPIICGHSEGGAIASQYAATHPDSISALVLADTDLNNTIEEVAGTIGLVFTELFAELEALKGINPLEAMAPSLEKKLYSKDFIEAHPVFISGWRKQFLSNSLEGVINGLRAWDRRPDIAKQLQKLSVPTLLLWGMEDVMIHLKQMQALQASLGGISQLSTLAGSGHMTPVEVPDQFNKVIGMFLNENVSPRAPNSKL